MSIMTSGSNSKFIREVKVNGIPVKTFIDLGSEVSLMQQTLASSLGLACSYPPRPLKGFGNNVISSIGGVRVDLCVDDVSADVVCHVVEDGFLETPLLMGQSFTEQAHILVNII
ncbi:unnamed protein product [Arctia plantaginis]|uniref:Aspartic peptidase DDI1-type domain-containing protein n=1 Tax=Arctia plantaginis TaxID=874455 RepID=A0A8S0YQC4_ARCPL|nr:unnamed protein product [Arctia plantaginis]